MASNDAPPNLRPRPLSPHLGIYRWQWTMALSILHRFTGLALVIGTLAIAWWLIAAALGGGHFETAQAFWASWLGRLMLFGWTIALFYHLCNGIRHLIWDTGGGLSLGAAYASGIAVIVGTLGLTAVAWVVAYAAL